MKKNTDKTMSDCVKTYKERTGKSVLRVFWCSNSHNPEHVPFAGQSMMFLHNLTRKKWQAVISLFLVCFITLPAISQQDFIEIDRFPGQRVPKSLLNMVSVNLYDVPFEKALQEVARKGNLKLNYNRDRIPVNKVVSVRMDNVAALEVLIKILKETGTGLLIIAEVPSPIVL